MQLPHDYRDQDWHDFTQRKQRRIFIRTSFRERLGPRKLEKVTKGHKVESKVRRTIGVADKERDDDNETQDRTRYYMDFDIGECMLDLPQDHDGAATTRRKLYAFSSLEVCLEDEDDSVFLFLFAAVFRPFPPLLLILLFAEHCKKIQSNIICVRAIWNSFVTTSKLRHPFHSVCVVLVQ